MSSLKTKIFQLLKFLQKRPIELILLFIVILLLTKTFNIQELSGRFNLFRSKQLPISSAQPAPSLKCSDQQLGIDKLDGYLKNNGLVLDLLRQNCEIVLGSSYFDVTGDLTPDILLSTSGFDCASCHQRVIRVIDGTSNKIIFALAGDDLAIGKPTFPITGFQIIEPLRKHGEPFCCATEGLSYTYIYSPKDKRDSGSDIDASYHNFASYNVVQNNDFFYLYDARSVEFKKN